MKAIVTGASSGIGAATVRELSAANYEVLAIARRQDRLAELEDRHNIRTVSADVRDIARLEREFEDFAPDLLINNAGVGHGIAGLSNLDPKIVQEAIDINITALVQLTGAVLPGMLNRGRGHIVNIGSISGLHTLVSALYGATKAAVHLFSQNLRYELTGSGIRVTEICPGRVTSEFYEVAEGDRDRLNQMGASGIRELEPGDVAQAIMYAVATPPHVNVSTIEILPTDQSVGGARMKT